MALNAPLYDRNRFAFFKYVGISEFVTEGSSTQSVSNNNCVAFCLLLAFASPSRFSISAGEAGVITHC